MRDRPFDDHPGAENPDESNQLIVMFVIGLAPRALPTRFEPLIDIPLQLARRPLTARCA
jgi:hypothetical protein